MSKKMKGVLLDPSSSSGFDDAKARFKHRALLQDYQDLKKEAEAIQNKLKTTKQRKLTLLAEVRFLRQRYKYMMRINTVKPPQGREPTQPRKVEAQRKKMKKPKTHSRKEANLGNLATFFDLNQSDRVSNAKESSPILDLNHKERINSGKDATFRSKTPVFDLNQQERSYARMEAAFQKPTLILDWKQKERVYGGKETAPGIPDPAIERTSTGREEAVTNRAPIFDLNQISEEEAELRDSYEPSRFEELKKLGTDEQHNDLKLSVCRSVGSGPSRAGKRKITWQDQVALKV
ncbi:uncharacterized protein LOC127795208 [Diospyros lotus]|uniref:uncharacterized protein LOC127795208 n=1 Tax=Diospyros lotus TaxID=55363 RepID=UPI00224CBC89|nr:uncharacterized protein LOC127795208 [Diospyros lotus]XP_052182706.1 uncharacterized protein LOC127795208 [Diospyros lotus]XP_052182707.1 uncharacterized protein LOC127795208 [Diospyros lotus]